MATVSFPARSNLMRTLRQRTNDYFAMTGQSPRDDWRAYLKIAVILSLFLFSYIQLVFFTSTWLGALGWGFLLGQSIVLIGFNIMHDGAHGALSSRSWVNRLAARSLDMIGGSVHLWRIKHNILHHTYTNIDSHDDDLDSGGRMRFSPDQPYQPFHRYQRFYAFPLYSLLALHWIVSDFKEFFGGKIGDYKFDQPSRRDVGLFLLGKAVFLGYALVLPMFFHPWYVVLAVFVGVELVVGFFMALVFQLAHIVEAVDFPEPHAETGAVEQDWATHQLATTADFATWNPIVTWYSGGLNHQVEHHLFPKVSHVHYPQLRQIVRQTCREFGAPYHEHKTVVGAVVSHIKLLSRLGQRHPTGAAA